MATATQKLVQIGTTANTLAPGARMVIDPDLRDAENVKLDVESATVGDGFLLLSLNTGAGTFDVQNIGSVADTCTFTAYAFYSASLNPTETTSTPTSVASANPAMFLGYAPNWDPSAPPATPNALDDEFNSGTLTGWNDYDFGNVGVNTVDSTINKMTITQTKSALGEEVTGLYRDAPSIPASDYGYTVWTRASLSTQDLSDYPAFSLSLGVDMSLPGTTGSTASPPIVDVPGGEFYQLSLMRASQAWLIIAQRMDGWNLYGANIGTAEVVQSTHVYLRLRVRYTHATTTTSMFFDYSSDGVGWKSLNAGASEDYTSGELKSIGCTVNDSSGIAGVETVGLFDFFRVYDGYAFDTTSQGALVNLNKST